MRPAALAALIDALGACLTLITLGGIMRLTYVSFVEVAMSRKRPDPKEEALRAARALNPRPEAVTASEFAASEFFDPRDLVQVKYEMLRRVRQEGSSVSEAAASFGFSRPSFYEAKAAYEAAGMPGLLPKRPGPRRAHKLADPIVERLASAAGAQPSPSSVELAELAEREFGVHVHPRSVERALARRPKDPRGPRP
jgi:transposase